MTAIHRHTGGLEKNNLTAIRGERIHRHTGGLEIFRQQYSPQA